MLDEEMKVSIVDRMVVRIWRDFLRVDKVGVSLLVGSTETSSHHMVADASLRRRMVNRPLRSTTPTKTLPSATVTLDHGRGKR